MKTPTVIWRCDRCGTEVRKTEDEAEPERWRQVEAKTLAPLGDEERVVRKDLCPSCWAQVERLMQPIYHPDNRSAMEAMDR